MVLLTDEDFMEIEQYIYDIVCKRALCNIEQAVKNGTLEKCLANQSCLLYTSNSINQLAKEKELELLKDHIQKCIDMEVIEGKEIVNKSEHFHLQMC